MDFITCSLLSIVLYLQHFFFGGLLGSTILIPAERHDTRTTLTSPRWVWDTFPIFVAYLPIAFAFGVTAREVGISFTATALMSLFVYAGASQMVALGLIASGQSVLTIVLTTFLINLRLLLLGAAMSPLFVGWSKKHRILFGMQLTDETFAALAARFQGDIANPRHAFGVNVGSHIAWLSGSILGYGASGMVMEVRSLGLDYALIGMLIGMMGLMVRTKRQAIVASVSGGLGVGFALVGWAHVAMLAAALVGPTLGLILERRWNRR